jgi:hypothetical protein
MPTAEYARLPTSSESRRPRLHALASALPNGEDGRMSIGVEAMPCYRVGKLERPGSAPRDVPVYLEFSKLAGCARRASHEPTLYRGV